MTANIPDNFMDLVQEPAIAHLATLMRDGSPQVTPVWFDFDGEHLRLNSARGRIKDLNMRRNPGWHSAFWIRKIHIGILRFAAWVTEISESGADAHIDQLAKKYLSVERYPHRTPGEIRVMYKVKPSHVSTMG